MHLAKMLSYSLLQKTVGLTKKTAKTFEERISSGAQSGWLVKVKCARDGVVRT